MSASRAVRSLTLVATLTAAVGLAAGCDMLGGRDRALETLHGTVLTPAQAKPAFTLTDTRGQPYDFSKETSGMTTLLYFGYTSCPDVCPAQLGSIAAALRLLDAETRAKIRVVFVTTDPARDSVAKLRAWLNGFDSTFIGLRGDAADVNRIEGALGLPPSVPEPMPATHSMPASYAVGHATRVLAFTPDDSLRVNYPTGVLPADWAQDLGRLAKFTKR